jgi:replicative DNA helicase
MNPTLLTGAVNSVPHDEAAERSVLSAALLAQDAFADILAAVRTDDFYTQSNRLIYDAMRSMFDKSMPIEQSICQ